MRGRQQLITIVTLALLGPFAFVGGANAWAATSRRVATNQRKACARKILQPPRLKKAVMYHPGTSQQETITGVDLDAVTGCDSWRRLTKARTQLKRNGRWINMNGPLWLPLGRGGSHANEAQEAGLILAAPNQFLTDHCVHGHREPARVQVQSSMRSASTEKVIAKGRIRTRRIKVEGGC